MLTQNNFESWDDYNKWFKSLSPLSIPRTDIKTMYVVPVNGTAVMGAYVNSQGYLYVMGFITKNSTSIDGSYQFRLVIGY